MDALRDLGWIAAPGVSSALVSPLGAIAKGLTHRVRYPVLSPFLRRRGEEER